jgi:hypothetical protein
MGRGRCMAALTLHGPVRGSWLMQPPAATQHSRRGRQCPPTCSRTPAWRIRFWEPDPSVPPPPLWPLRSGCPARPWALLRRRTFSSWSSGFVYPTLSIPSSCSFRPPLMHTPWIALSPAFASGRQSSGGGAPAGTPPAPGARQLTIPPLPLSRLPAPPMGIVPTSPFKAGSRLLQFAGSSAARTGSDTAAEQLPTAPTVMKCAWSADSTVKLRAAARQHKGEARISTRNRAQLPVRLCVPRPAMLHKAAARTDGAPPSSSGLPRCNVLTVLWAGNCEC